MNKKDLEHLRILKSHLELYKDCIQQGQIEMLSTFIETTLHTVNRSISIATSCQCDFVNLLEGGEKNEKHK